MASSVSASFFSVGARKPRLISTRRFASLLAIITPTGGRCMSVSPSCLSAPAQRRLPGCAGASRPTEIIPCRIGFSPRHCRCSVHSMRRGPPRRRPLCSIRPSRSVVTERRATAWLISRDASVCVRACAWPGYWRGDVGDGKTDQHSARAYALRFAPQFRPCSTRPALRVRAMSENQGLALPSLAVSATEASVVSSRKVNVS